MDFLGKYIIHYHHHQTLNAYSVLGPSHQIISA